MTAPARRLGAAHIPMSEETLEEHVRALCVDLQIVRVHHRDSRGTFPGWVDDVLIGTGVLFRELKTEIGRVSPAQQRMHDALAAAGADVAIWRPVDLASGRIARELAAISPRMNRAGRTPAPTLRKA